MSYVPNLKYKTAFCENYLQNGNCLKGTICHFAHGQKELRSLADNQKIISEQNTYFKAMTQQTNYPSNYKTIKCKFYQKGKCELGDNCTYVHENSERRPKPQIQNLEFYIPWANYGNQGIQGAQYPEGINQQYYGHQNLFENGQQQKLSQDEGSNILKKSTETQNSPQKEEVKEEQMDQKSEKPK